MKKTVKNNKKATYKPKIKKVGDRMFKVETKSPPMVFSQRIAESDIKASKFKVGDFVYTLRTGTKKLRILEIVKPYCYSNCIALRVTESLKLENEIESFLVDEEEAYLEVEKEKMLFDLVSEGEDLLRVTAESVLKLNDKFESFKDKTFKYSLLTILALSISCFLLAAYIG